MQPIVGVGLPATQLTSSQRSYTTGALLDKAEFQHLDLGAQKQMLTIAFCYFGVVAMQLTSLNDLPATFAVKPSRIYASFGDKKPLFLEVVTHHLSGQQRPVLVTPIRSSQAVINL
jgi:hypothetical protein